MTGEHDAPTLRLRRVEVEGRLLDVTVARGRVVAVEPTGTSDPARVDDELDGDGGALLPGLHDHHLHLLATAAARASVRLDRPDVRTPADLRRELQEAARRAGPDDADGWIRAVGYHESIAGDLDRRALDDAVPDRPVRVQHRSGALWVLNSRALERIGGGERAPGVERAADGRPNGRFFRADAWLGARWPAAPVDLGAVSRELLRLGVTGVTDATPFADGRGPATIAAAVRAGAFGPRVTVMGGPELVAIELDDAVARGPVKLLLPDHDLPDHLALVGSISAAHAHGRPVAVHCVTADALVLTLSAFTDIGPVPGDRIEHASVVPPGLEAEVAALGLRVVTQPGFVRTRGDDYRRDVAAEEQAWLWPCRRLLDAGVGVAAGSDAPHGDLDPWMAIAAAVDRRTASGAVLAGDEAVDAARALDLWLAPRDDPGGRPRRVEVGARADLCLLDVPLATALAAPDAGHVRATLVGGVVRFGAVG